VNVVSAFAQAFESNCGQSRIHFMHPESNSLTRREALLKAIKGTVAVTLAVPVITSAAQPPSTPEPEFVFENDYPFFGPEPESHA
jgi:hypothetical protein